MVGEFHPGAGPRDKKAHLALLRGVEGGGNWWEGVTTSNTDVLLLFLLPDQATPQL